MSMTGGQMFGAVVGAAVGFFTFNPAAGYSVYAAMAAGAAIGMTVGGIVDPHDAQVVRQQGPRLGELDNQTSEWGAPIRRLFGAYKLSGNVIWSLPLHETKHVEESGEGKGGGGTKTETTWYSYAGSWACGFSEGEILSVKKIWFDSVLVYDGTKYRGGLEAGNHTIYPGSPDQPVDWYMDNGNTPAYRNLFYIVFRAIELENYGNRIPKVSVEAVRISETTKISQIADELLLRSGYEASDFDTSEGTDIVNGYVVTNPMDTRAAITSLISAYSFELIEVNSKLLLHKRNPTSIATIDDDDIIEFVEIKRMQTVELSRQVNILYSNRDNNYNAGTQTALRIDPDTDSTKTYQFPLALSSNDAKRVAERFLFSEWSERSEFVFATTQKFLNLVPSDTVTLNYDGNIYLVRLTKVNYVTDNSVSIEAVLENGEVYTSNAIGSDTGSVDYTIVDQADTVVKLLDIPMLDNSVNYEGIYVAVAGTTSNWNGASVYKSTDNQVTYNKTLDLLSQTIMGETTTVLPDGITHGWDYNSVTVTSNALLYDENEKTVLEGKNYILIGDEVLQYTYATDNFDGTFTLSQLLRGRRGTEWSTGTHAVGERFIFLSNKLGFDRTAALNVNSYYKGVTFGSYLEDASSEYIVPKIICQKPFSPSYVRGERNTGNDLLITWMRRSRDVTGYFKTLTLMEDEEKFEIDILDSADNVVSTKIINNESYYEYTDADQLAEIPSHNTGDPVKINIYQMSGTVQRGYVTSEIL